MAKDYTEQLDYLKQLEAQDTTRKQIGWQDLPRVHIIAIADFHRSKAKKNGILNGDTVTETYAFRPECDQSNSHLFDQWRATLVDLKKFEDKPLDELHKYKDWWFFLLKNASRIKEEELEKLKKDPIFRVALERLEHLSSDPETRKAYEESINEQRNLDAIKQASVKEGHEEGRKEGLEEGRKEGRKEGLEEGKMSIAKKLFQKGMSLQEVAEMTELDIKDIQSLKRAKASKL